MIICMYLTTQFVTGGGVSGQQTASGRSMRKRKCSCCRTRSQKQEFMERYQHIPYCSPGHVTELNLLGNRLNGEIPDYLAELPLVKLELSQNNFTGMLPCGSHQPFWRSVGVHRFELSLPKVVYRNGFFTKHYQKPSAGIPGRNVAASSHTHNSAQVGGRMIDRTE